MMKYSNRPLRAAHCKNAFSLVEIVIAIGVTCFCILAIISLFPVGTNTALESRRETRAAYLVEQLVSDLRSSSFTNVVILSRQTNGTLSPVTSVQPFSLAAGSTNYFTCDVLNNVLGTATAAQYASGINDSSVIYLVQLTVAPMALTNLSQVSVEVSTPAQGPLNARSRYGFQTMIGERQ